MRRDGKRNVRGSLLFSARSRVVLPSSCWQECQRSLASRSAEMSSLHSTTANDIYIYSAPSFTSGVCGMAMKDSLCTNA